MHVLFGIGNAQDFRTQRCGDTEKIIFGGRID